MRKSRTPDPGHAEGRFRVLTHGDMGKESGPPTGGLFVYNPSMICQRCGAEFTKRAGTKFCDKRCRELNWCEKHPDEVLAQARARSARWRGRNPDHKLSYDRAHPEVVAKHNRSYRQRYPEKERAKNSRRRAALLNRTPAWADHHLIDAFYANCPAGMEVDHVLPLQGKTVSGLHVHINLQYLTPTKNRQKKNRVYCELLDAA